MTQTNDFLDANYEIPRGPSNYTKLEEGDTKVRILSKPLLGWQYFNNDNKPVRIEGATQPSIDKSLIKIDKYSKQQVKHFWAMVVWNYKVKEIQVLEVSQSSIQGRIKELSKSTDWGSPFAYDITINKSGTGVDTEYSVTPIPPKPLSDEAKSAFKSKPCNLRALLVSGDPFAENTPVIQSAPIESIEDIDPLPF